MKKKALAILMATAMTASMAACGNSGSTSGNNADKGGSDKTEDAGTTDDAAADDSAEEEAITCDLTVWGPSEDQAEENGNWLPTMCEAFAAEHPNWTINFTYGVCAEGDAKANVTQDVEGAADVYMYANDNITDLVAAGALAKLGGETAEYVQSTNSETVANSVTIDGDLYGIPFTTNTWYMYYDTSVFSEDDVKNLDTMLEKGKVSFPLNNSWYMGAFYVGNGCTIFGTDGTDEDAGMDYEGDKATAVTNYLVDLVANKNFVNDADGAGLTGLRDGSINAIFSGSWDAGSVKEALGDNFGAVSLPTYTLDGEEKQMMAFAGSKAIGVNPNCDNMQVAVALARYLASPEAQQAHYDMRTIVPCNTELLAQDAIASDAIVTAQNDTFNNTSIIQPFVGKMGQYWDPTKNFADALLNGDVTHDNAAEKTEQYNTQLNTAVAE